MGIDRTELAPVLFGYDGSELARDAIEQAARELSPGRHAVALCVWQPAEVGFVPVGDGHLDAQNASEVQQAAEEIAAQGASLAELAGFRAESLAINASPTWRGIVEVAEKRGASLIVLGAHRRRSIVGHLLGSVTAAVVTHATVSVLVVQERAGPPPLRAAARR